MPSVGETPGIGYARQQGRLGGTVRARGAGRSALGDVSSREVVEAHLEGFLVWRRGAGLPHHNI